MQPVKTPYRNSHWLNMDSGQLLQKHGQKRLEQALAPHTDIVDKLEKAQIQRQVLLGDAPMGTQPGSQ